MEVTCPRCRNSSFSVSQSGAVSLHCLACGANYAADGVVAERVRQVPVKPRLQWIFK
jgi:hypothetical protein